MRGRKPTPWEMKVVGGTDRKDRRPAAPPDEVAVALPKPPKTFDADERRAWKALTKAYSLQHRLIQPSEFQVHVDYVTATVLLDRSKAELRALEVQLGEGAEALADALPDADRDLWERREKVLRRINQQLERKTKLAAELGLTPSARSRAGFAVPKAKPASQWENLGRKERAG